MSATGKAVRAGKNLPNYPGREGWEKLVGPFFEPVARNVAGAHVQKLLGFWVVWHACGGSVADVQAAKVISLRGIYGQRKEFLEAFGVDVEDFLPVIGASIRATEKEASRA